MYFLNWYFYVLCNNFCANDLMYLQHVCQYRTNLLTITNYPLPQSEIKTGGNQVKNITISNVSCPSNSYHMWLTFLNCSDLDLSIIYHRLKMSLLKSQLKWYVTWAHTVSFIPQTYYYSTCYRTAHCIHLLISSSS